MGASANGAHYDGPSPVLRWATNEWTLLFIRGAMVAFAGVAGVAASLALFVLSDIRTAAADMKAELADMRRTMMIDQLSDANRMGKIESAVGRMEGSINAHEQRLGSHEKRIERLEERR